MHDIKFINIFTFIFCLFFSISFSAMANQDYGSILDRDFLGDKPAIIAHGVDIKLIGGEKKSIDYPVTKKEFEDKLGVEASEINRYCPNQKCTCEEKIGYFEFSGKPKGLDKINKTEKENSKKLSCNWEMSSIDHLSQFGFANLQLASVAIYEVEYGLGAGGSCHGHHKMKTYDAETGSQYILQNIIKTEYISKLNDALLKDFMARYAENNINEITDDKEKKEHLENIKKSVQKYLKETSVIEQGFVVENGKVYTNIDNFLFSCAEGNFFPVEVPKEFITPEFLEKLKE